jgi:hypothetical protein
MGARRVPSYNVITPATLPTGIKKILQVIYPAYFHEPALLITCPLFPYFAHVLHVPQPTPLDRENPMAIITVVFSGRTLGSFIDDINGSIVYDQAQPVTPGSSPPVFDFTGSASFHALKYHIGPTGPVSGTQGGCDPFQITIPGSTFLLHAQLPQSPPVTAQILIPMTKSLPVPPSLPDSSFFPISTSGTFTLSGASSLTGTITTIHVFAS